MQGEKVVIAMLNKVLTWELTSINQYFLHARLFRHFGFNALNEHDYKKSIKDMKQADALIERILFLDGLPNLQNLEYLRIGEHAEEMLQCNLSLQQDQLVLLREAIVVAEQASDFVSRDLLEEILEYEEEYLDWLETQQNLIATTGIQNYLQSQM
ncbi:bacterioferritin [Tolumonas lignilytica]|jgi:bacterioferritin|uniref:bacterioferritin n=1 Tax=Tolumonas lignilytica TaxID=1283284 RepID=UPI0004662617|nr:bacterioferritin [Tolumonas lignilytica]